MLRMSRLLLVNPVSVSVRTCNIPPDLAKDAYVPTKPSPSKIDESRVAEPPEFDEKLITHLERLSLVRFTNEEAVAHLREAVRYANRLLLVETKNVEPLETVLEDIDCPLRDDVVDNPVNKEKVLMNASKLVEDYFVTPPGNIPLEEENKMDMKKINIWDWTGSKPSKKFEK
ncbi:hypothetical protein AB6A40_010537 [Gnathostoma spinigerum]|uniref:Glutamyl-tRNA(Gln) amidotransferase subunit C, mitochondrial n=1 Tax=Gnathostoma spinigerum TaxID=75299 RepID=A0ABD6EV54_9BILA